jgi:transposase
MLITTKRRRAQNRAAQRAYRQRKDQSLKQREKEVEDLRDQLDKAQRLNKTLCKVVAVLRERLNEPDEEIDAP